MTLLYQKLFLLFSILTLSTQGIGQHPITPDSIQRGFKQLEPKEEKLNYLNDVLQQLETDSIKEKYYNDTLLSQNYYKLGAKYHFINEEKKAIHLLNAALVIKKEIYPKDHIDIVRCYWKSAQTYKSLGDIDKAIHQNETAMDLLESRKMNKRDSLYLARIYGDLARDYGDYGEYAYEDYFNKSTSIFKQIGKPIEEIRVMNNYGFFLSNLKESNKAINILRDAKDEIESKHKNQMNSNLHNNIIINLGTAYLQKDEPTEAIRIYEQALHATKKNSTAFINISSNIGIPYLRIKKYDKALKHLEESLLASKIYYKAKNHYSYAAIYDNMGDVYFAKGDLRTALLNYQAAIQQLIPNLQEETSLLKNPNLDTMQIIGSPIEFLTFISSKGKTLKKLYEKTDSISYLENAIDTYHATDQLIDYIRRIHKEKKSKLFWRETTHPIYEQAVQTAQSNDDLESVFYFMEKSKAVLLADGLNEKEALHYSSLPDSTIQEINELKLALSKYDTINKGYILSKIKLENKIESLENNNSAYYQYKYNIDFLSIDDVKNNLLSDNTAFIQYFVSDSFIYSITITRNDIQSKAIRYSSDDLSNFKQLIEFAQDERSYKTKKGREKFQHVNRKISELIWSQNNPKINRFIVSPDSWLNYLNFEMLLNPSSEKNDDFLIKENTFNYTWSATILDFVRQEKEKNKNNLLTTAPMYFNYSNGVRLNPLNKSTDELDYICQSINGTRLEKEEATFDKLIEQLKNSWRIIHFSTHAQAKINHEDGYLALYDSLLTIDQIFHLPIENTELVVLSACNTSGGDYQEGEGVVSIARAFIYAGASSIVSSVWDVGEESTAELMDDFYAGIQQGKPKDAALREAKLIQIEEGKAPFYWASFVSIGNSESIIIQNEWLTFFKNNLLLIFMIFSSIFLVYCFWRFYLRKNSE